MGSTNEWPYKAGRKGENRVRAFEHSGSGIIYLEFWVRDPETGERYRKRVSTKHRDREKARDQADQLAGEFATDPPEHDPGITLRTLFDNYLEKRTPQVSERQRRHHRRCSEMFCRYFGWDREVESLNRKDWDGFVLDRGSGAIDARGHEVPKEEDRTTVGARRIRQDLQTLRAAFNWAVQADLIDYNPTAQYPLPKKDSPSRPRLADERYEAMLEVAPEVDWRFHVALVLANETGHRSKAIRRLRWSDVDLAAGTIRWRGAEDKTGHEHVTPLTDAASDILRRTRADQGAIGESWLLPSPEDESKPVSRHLLRDWWYRAEELAELEHIDGLGWHGLRRKFADEHKDVPLKDLAQLGGWKTEQTILKCYQGSDLEAMRRAQERRQPLRREASGDD